MGVTYVDPDELHPPHGYRHVAVATSGRTAYCAGQVSVDYRGQVLGAGDHAAQAEQAMANMITALRAAGADLSGLVKLNFYVVGLDATTQEQVYRGLGRCSREHGVPRVPATMVGVTALAMPELLIEVDAIAVIG